jgi:hypothetical protein
MSTERSYDANREILIELMSKLKLTENKNGEIIFNYASMDAESFPQCIKPEYKNAVLKRAKKAYHGPVTKLGAGAYSESSFTSTLIQQTAEKVQREKRGACHTFAQLAAHHLLTQMQEKNINPPMNIKIVSYPEGITSHTFLLLNHTSNNLKELENCLIVDPWAAVMGYYDSEGVFDVENYPYTDMLFNLQLVYDASTDKEWQKKLNQNKSSKKKFPQTNKAIFSGDVKLPGISIVATQKPVNPGNSISTNSNGFFKQPKKIEKNANEPILTEKHVLDFIDLCIEAADEKFLSSFYHEKKD